MSRYRDDRAALAANVERLRRELEDAEARLAALDGDAPAPGVEIEEILGAPGHLGTPNAIGLRASLPRALRTETLEAIAAMLRLRLNLPVSVHDGGLRTADGRFDLETTDGRTELRLDWTFEEGARRHQLGAALSTLVSALGGAVLLHEGVGLTAASAVTSLLFIVPVAGAILVPLLRPPYARRVLHEQELLRDAFRAAVALASEEGRVRVRLETDADEDATDEEEDEENEEDEEGTEEGNEEADEAGAFEGDASGSDERA